jgi:hypothetical protein
MTGRRRGSAKIAVTGRSAAWLARLTGGQEVGGSNPPVPTAIRCTFLLRDRLGPGRLPQFVPQNLIEARGGILPILGEEVRVKVHRHADRRMLKVDLHLLHCGSVRRHERRTATTTEVVDGDAVADLAILQERHEPGRKAVRPEGVPSARENTSAFSMPCGSRFRASSANAGRCTTVSDASFFARSFLSMMVRSSFFPLFGAMSGSRYTRPTEPSVSCSGFRAVAQFRSTAAREHTFAQQPALVGLPIIGYPVRFLLKLVRQLRVSERWGGCW